MATVKEIAELAKVSIGTVDRVIHNRGRVSAETKEKVERIIEELGYQPNFFAKNLRRTKSFKFGVLMPQPGQDNGFWELLLPGIKRAKNQLEAYNVKVNIYYYDRNSEVSFREESGKLMASNPDGIVIAPVVMPEIERFVKQLPETLPFAFVDSAIEGCHNLLQVGYNSYQSGLTAGRLMQILVGNEKSTIAIFRSHMQEQHMKDRTNGFCKFFENNTNINFKYYDIHGVEDNELYNGLTQKALDENPNLKGIFVTNAYSHGVAKFLERNKKKEDIALVGYDLVPENIRQLRAGTIDFLISLRPGQQGFQALFSLYYHIVQDKTVEKEVLIPIDILTKENIDFYNILGGY